MPLSCRFYANKHPEVEDTVMVNVRSIADMGAYVSLREYDNIEGMILLSELSRRRIRSVNKLIRVGRDECVVVIRVDPVQGYIDLSKRRVYAKDLVVCENRFARAKAVNSILRHVAEQLNFDSNEQLEDLYERTAWHFDRKAKKKADSYDAFKKAISDPSILDECDITDEVKEALLEDIRKRLTPQAVKIRADMEVSCFAYDGIDAVKSALTDGLKCSTDEMPIKINLIAPPHYFVLTNTLERAEGLAAVGAALERVKQTIEAAGGNFKVVAEARVVTGSDEDDIKKRMELLELDADDAPDDDDDGLQAPEGLDQQLDAAIARGQQPAAAAAAADDE